MTKEIYLIRHGETDYNLFKKVQGSGVDTDLNSTGRSQAMAFFDCYKHIQFDRVYASELRRSQQTLEPFRKMGVEMEITSGLNEICWGLHEGKVTSSLDNTYYGWLMNEWRTGNTNIQIRGGESPDEVAERQRPFIELIRKRQDEKRILVCLHGRALRILLCQMLGYSLQDMDRFSHHNLCLYILKLNASGRFELTSENDGRHLDSICDQMRA